MSVEYFTVSFELINKELIRIHMNSQVNKNTHFIFDGQGIFLSPDIAPVFNFLMEIEKEVESVLGFQKKLDDVSGQVLDILKCLSSLGKKLEENNIDFNYNLKEIPVSIVEKLSFNLPIRSQAIVLFASLEVLFALHSAYEHGVDDEDDLRKIMMDEKFLKKFINSFLLTDDNDYYSKNKIRLSKIDSRKIRNLRNSLTHFFSLSGTLGIVPEPFSQKARKLESILKKNKHGDIVFISPEDLHELIKSAYKLRMIKWSMDFQADPIEFKRKMQFVINAVEKHGAVMVSDDNLNIK